MCTPSSIVDSPAHTRSACAQRRGAGGAMLGQRGAVRGMDRAGLGMDDAATASRSTQRMAGPSRPVVSRACPGRICQDIGTPAATCGPDRARLHPGSMQPLQGSQKHNPSAQILLSVRALVVSVAQGMGTPLRSLASEFARLGSDCVPITHVLRDRCKASRRLVRLQRGCSQSLRGLTRMRPAMVRNLRAVGQDLRAFTQNLRALVRDGQHGSSRPKTDDGLCRTGLRICRTDLGIARPQTGHCTAQACPSKHPDGFREALG